MPRIYITSVFVDDQAAALDFYTRVLGFAVKHDVPMGSEHRWLTVTAPGDDAVELLLEPSAHPAVGPYREALVGDGIPLASFQVEDLDAEFERLTGLGVTFTQEPVAMGPFASAVIDDTCGNLIQLVQML
ncbi:MAG: VOC family protein [Actinomycetota bacterium]|nr:VOC family protein [Actinomycetota bacterium]